jgi:DnaJ like chaperone protein
MDKTMIWGKILGVIFGFAFLNLPGAILGLWLGHRFDKGVQYKNFGYARDPQLVQLTFFSTVFQTMGHIAKADGRVSENEIQMAKAVMSHMGLNEERRQSAIDNFNRGKQPEFDLNACLRQFIEDCGRAPNLMQMFIEIQISAAFADGTLGGEERQVLEQVAQQIGISSLRLNLLINSVEAQQRYHQSQQQGQSQQARGMQLNDAYQLLCVASSASDKEVKRAYRKMMSQHHPDKLAAKGMPDDMLEVAKEKTQEIQAAWELIRKHRNIR